VRDEKAITLGHPSYVWRFGQDRRLALIRRYVPLDGQRVLDVGCGLGMYVRAFRAYTSQAFGVEIDLERAVEAGQHLPNITLAPGERLPFPDGSFDAVLLHEVIEHMADDRQAITEAVRVLRPGGRVVVFAPNRLYPFETHGVYWRGHYHFGNVPLVGYLPDGWRHRFAPHVRAYTTASLRQLLNNLPVNVVVHTQVYPGYDNLVGRHPALGQALRRATYLAEGTPLRAFGLSHFLVAEKRQNGR
jgi:SAM-dependent methyltransferase